MQILRFHLQRTISNFNNICSKARIADETVLDVNFQFKILHDTSIFKTASDQEKRDLALYTKSALSVLQGILEIVRYNEKFDFNRQFRLSARKN